MQYNEQNEDICAQLPKRPLKVRPLPRPVWPYLIICPVYYLQCYYLLIPVQFQYFQVQIIFSLTGDFISENMYEL